MPEILYSDIEVTAKVVMDPHTMEIACGQIDRLLESTSKRDYGALRRVRDEMRQVLSRLADMHVI